MDSLKETALDALIVIIAWAAVTAGSLFAQPAIPQVQCDATSQAANQ